MSDRTPVPGESRAALALRTRQHVAHYLVGSAALALLVLDAQGILPLGEDAVAILAVWAAGAFGLGRALQRHGR